MFVSMDAGRCALTAEAQRVGQDFLVLLTGGEAHIGSVSCAAGDAPLHSLQYPHHRDAALGDRFALGLQQALGCKVVVICGVHVDNASGDEIARILEAGDALLRMLAEKLLEANKGTRPAG